MKKLNKKKQLLIVVDNNTEITSLKVKNGSDYENIRGLDFDIAILDDDAYVKRLQIDEYIRPTLIQKKGRWIRL